MPNRKHESTQHESPAAANESAVVIDFAGYRAHPPDPAREPFSGEERALLRMLLELGPGRIMAAVTAVEHLRHACPTARRELEDLD